jgi:serine/threonine protein phosphatase PrpC
MLYNLKPANETALEFESENISEYYITNCTIIKEYAYKEEQNSKYRNYMEDKGKSINNFNNSPNNVLFCLFDGHGGHEVSTYLQSNFSTEFKNIIQNTPKNTDLTNIFMNLCKDIDEKIKNENYNNIGSTGCIVYITEENNKKYLYCVNLGDTRCVLLKDNNDYLRLSYDDRASDEAENKRIIDEGGMVFSGRVFGILMLSRAFGDWELKEYGVSNVPHVYKMEITNDCKNLIIASDGIWDVINESELNDLMLESINSKDLCDKIMNLTVERGSMDNLSCFVIKLN